MAQQKRKAKSKAKRKTKATPRKRSKTMTFDEWLEAPSTSRNSRTCQTCAMGEEVNNKIRKFMEAKSTGYTKRYIVELHDMLVEEYDYDLTCNALTTHMRRCERDLYLKMREGDIRSGVARGPSKHDKKLGRVYKSSKPRRAKGENDPI